MNCEKKCLKAWAVATEFLGKVTENLSKSNKNPSNKNKGQALRGLIFLYVLKIGIITSFLFFIFCINRKITLS